MSCDDVWSSAFNFVTGFPNDILIFAFDLHQLFIKWNSIWSQCPPLVITA